MTIELDGLMEQASAALAAMDYPRCERLCVQALDAARQQRDWAYVARITLPLQEARRQRRIIAAEGVIRLGATQLASTIDACIEPLADGGCIVLTQPFDAGAARQLQQLARERNLYIEVLLADNRSDDAVWTLRSFNGASASCTVPAPPAEWRERWLTPHEAPSAPIKPGVTPADWFLDALEKLGDAALASIDVALPAEARLAALHEAIEAVTDHEILHQRFADAARDADRERP